MTVGTFLMALCQPSSKSANSTNQVDAIALRTEGVKDVRQPASKIMATKWLGCRPAGSSRRPRVGEDAYMSASSPRALGSGLVSIGYEGRTADHLIWTLVDLKVSYLVDVRLTPVSRKPGLSKTKLRLALTQAGISYVHLPALGNPKENREPFRNGQVNDGCIEFSRLMDRPVAIAALDQLESLARDHLTAVLCFERDHDRCHRQVVVGAVHQRLGAGTVLIQA